MIKVGITGGIGSGKSFVCSIIEKIGYPVYYSDQESKLIVDKDPIIRQELISLLGTNAFKENQLNRKFIADQLFNSDEIRMKLNEIIHPKVRAYFNQWCFSQNSEIVFNEAAILFETESYKQFDSIVLVTAPDELKIQRVVKRDGLSESEIKQRMQKQWSDNHKAPLANFIVVNDGSPLLCQIELILEKLKQG